MSKELANKHGFEIGEKVLYPHQMGSNYGAPIHMSVVTLKDVVSNWKDEVVVLTEDNEGYLDLSDVYSLKMIMKMFESNEKENKNDNKIKKCRFCEGDMKPETKLTKIFKCIKCGAEVETLFKVKDYSSIIERLLY